MIMVDVDLILLDSNVGKGADYRLYLTPKYVETEPGSETIKAQSLQIGPLEAFDNF